MQQIYARPPSLRIDRGNHSQDRQQNMPHQSQVKEEKWSFSFTIPFNYFHSSA